MNVNVRGALIALVAFGVFAGHDALIKQLGGTYSAFQIVFFAVLFSFPLTTLMLVQDKTSGTLIPRQPVWTVTRTIAVVIGGTGAFYAFSVLPLAEVYAILFSVPILITLLSIPLLNERIRIRRWIAIVVGLAGVLVVLQPGSVTLENGHLAALMAAFASALASVIVRKVGKSERPVVLLIYPMLGQFLLMACAMPFVYVPMAAIDLAFVALIAIFGHIAMRLMIRAYRSAEAGVVAPMQYSQILWAALFGAMFFGEFPEWTTGIGAAVIIGSGLYILLRERSGSSENRPVTATRSRVVPGTHPRVGPAMDGDGSDGVELD